MRRMTATSSEQRMAPPQDPRGSEALTDAEHLQRVARRLNREFGAPLGLIDPVDGAWRVQGSAVAEALPPGGPRLIAALTGSGIGPNRAALWRPECEADRVGTGDVIWLVLPVPREER